ncbi:hypothetical protein B0I37DRAFT_173622 [Chaetomium sp. MPI-CAGE-AT-0009]|nr:hypothetical protein B0I37DRAFT_173622 [Chaetomium sp. MPI-CAGE-AT-0009]
MTDTDTVTPSSARRAISPFHPIECTSHPHTHTHPPGLGPCPLPARPMPHVPVCPSPRFPAPPRHPTPASHQADLHNQPPPTSPSLLLRKARTLSSHVSRSLCRCTCTVQLLLSLFSLGGSIGDFNSGTEGKITACFPLEPPVEGTRLNEARTWFETANNVPKKDGFVSILRRTTGGREKRGSRWQQGDLAPCISGACLRQTDMVGRVGLGGGVPQSDDIVCAAATLFSLSLYKGKPMRRRGWVVD